MTILYCPNRILLKGKRILFLAGPNRGAPPWRRTAISFLYSRVPKDVVIATPERLDDAVSGPYSPEKRRQQIDWELDHLLFAATAGVWLFWLPVQTRNRASGSYGQRTGHELGMSAVLRKYADARVVYGAEAGYRGLASTKRTFDMLGGELERHSTLEATCEAALKELQL